MADWRYVCHDLRTNAYLGDVPAGNVTWSEGENAQAQLSFTVDLAERSGLPNYFVLPEQPLTEDPPGSGLYTASGLVGVTFVESPPGSGLFEATTDRDMFSVTETTPGLYAVAVRIPAMRLGGQYRDMLRPGRTKVTPLRNGTSTILGSHIVWGRQYDGRNLSVSCAGMWSYWTADGGAEPLWQDRTYTNVDQHDIGRALIAFAQQGTGDVGLLVATNDSGVLRTETYFGRELARVGTRVDELAARENGFEFSVTTAMVNDAPVSTWRPWYPRRGKRYADSKLTFTLGQNLRAFTLDDGPPVTGFRAFGAGEGAAMLQAVASDASLVSQGYPSLVRSSASEYKDVSVQATLLGHTRDELRRLNDEAQIWTLELVDPDDVSTPFGAWQVGDDAKIVIPPDLDDYYPEGVEVVKRIIGQSVTISDDGGEEQITLTMGAARG